jgi:hypothetical protein
VHLALGRALMEYRDHDWPVRARPAGLPRR